jgi:hypothetical protein
VLEDAFGDLRTDMQYEVDPRYHEPVSVPSVLQRIGRIRYATRFRRCQACYPYCQSHGLGKPCGAKQVLSHRVLVWAQIQPYRRSNLRDIPIVYCSSPNDAECKIFKFDNIDLGCQ